MFSIRLNRKLLILALIGVALYLSVVAWYGIQGEDNPDSMPSQPPVTQATAEAKALEWYGSHMSGPPARAEETVYITDKKTEAYLAKNDLLDEYDKKLKKTLPLEFWRVELAVGDRQRVYVLVGLDEARVFGFQAAKPFSEQAPVVEQGTPNQAENGLRAIGFNPSDFTMGVPDSEIASFGNVSLKIPFTAKALSIGEAKVVVNVHSNQTGITQSAPSFQLPADFVSWLNGQDRGAAVYSFLYMAGAFIFGLVGLILMIVKRKNARFSRGILFSLVFLSAISLYTYNSLPAQKASVAPSQLASISDSLLFFSSLVIYALLAVSVYFNAVSGDVLWRERGWNPWPRWKDDGFGRHVYASMGRGYLISIFIMGVQQVLFLFAFEAFDTFSVSDPSQSLDNLYWPWLFPTLAWYAGIGEELAFRLFGIALFRKMLPEGKSRVGRQLVRFLCVLLPALVWAAGHAAYAFYPNYTRLFEVTALGLIFGYVFLRYGLYTAIFAHVSMDIILMSLSYMTAEKTVGAILLGLFYMATPLLVAVVIRFLHGRFHRRSSEQAEGPA
ncbi:CPBP family intramembrane glutamic endopeptidase [Gorillibacterium sp. sgz500922]|uniref:CPBP family intramembrane glutamic endopeptidase n=1 Tax=Gorillibacterium sp. sgz500922 TaxID=3446694 RepID=UPI003F67B193